MQAVRNQKGAVTKKVSASPSSKARHGRLPGTHWIKLATMALKCARMSLRISTSLSFSASKSMRVKSTYSRNRAPRAKVSRSKAPFVLEGRGREPLNQLQQSSKRFPKTAHRLELTQQIWPLWALPGEYEERWGHLNKIFVEVIYLKGQEEKEKEALARGREETEKETLARGGQFSITLTCHLSPPHLPGVQISGAAAASASLSVPDVSCSARKEVTALRLIVKDNTMRTWGYNLVFSSFLSKRGALSPLPSQ